MISNQILQNTIDGLKGITRIDLCVLDMEGQGPGVHRKAAGKLGGRSCGFYHITCRQPGCSWLSVF